MAKDPVAENHAWWEERASIHPTSPMYRPWLEQLRAGQPALFPLERRLVGDVKGKRLLHVPCHIGHDSLSWAMLGAEVTGVDFSNKALTEAKALATSLGLAATWVESDACALPSDLDGRFDVVVATYGAYGWMYDLDGWIHGIARALVPGGRFVLVDGHPLALALVERDGELVVHEPVMGGSPVSDERDGSYAAPDAQTSYNAHTGWCHGIGDLLRAITRQGMVIEHLDEHDHMVWQQLPSMVERDGQFVLPPKWHGKIPLMLSIVASKATIG